MPLEPLSNEWVRDALLALGLLLLAAGLIIFVRFFVVILYAALGAVLIAAGVALFRHMYNRR